MNDFLKSEWYRPPVANEGNKSLVVALHRAVGRQVVVRVQHQGQAHVDPRLASRFPGLRIPRRNTKNLNKLEICFSLNDLEKTGFDSHQGWHFSEALIFLLYDNRLQSVFLKCYWHFIAVFISFEFFKIYLNFMKNTPVACSPKAGSVWEWQDGF